MLRLAVHHDRSVKRFSLPVSETVLGASTDCDLVAPYPGVSRRHATLRPLDGGILITDLGSKNGLIKDGARLAEVLLRPRDRIRVGRAWIELEEVDSSEAAVVLTLPPSGHPAQSDRIETGALSELDGHGSPAPVLAVIRALERIDDPDPSAATIRDLLALLRVALEAESVWLWTSTPDGPSAVASAAGVLPEEALLDELVQAARVDIGPLVRLGNLVSSTWAARETSLACSLRPPCAPPAAWKLDLFEYVATRLRGTKARARPAREREEPRDASKAIHFPEEFVLGESTAMTKLVAALETATRSRLDVLLLGETGTGKELVARAIHDSSSQAHGPFLAINCAAIPAELLEAQLFGVEARVATGVDPRPGLFLKAHGGSLFLDEIGDLPSPLQPKLLRALQEREILPLGATTPKKVDVRVISASNKNLGSMARDGRFRADLFYRLRGLQFHMPPLRERREDLPHLVLVFVQRAALLYGKSIQGVSRKTLSVLSAYDWPGNVRELKNEVERAVLLCPQGGVLESSHFAPVAWAVENEQMTPAQPASAPPRAVSTSPAAEAVTSDAPQAVGGLGLRSQVDELERVAIVKALEVARGNKSRAASTLGITRNGLALKMKRLGIGN